LKNGALVLGILFFFAFVASVNAVAPDGVRIITPTNDTWITQRYLNLTGFCNSSTIPFLNATLDYNGIPVLNTTAITNATAFYFNQTVTSDGYYWINLTCYSSDGTSNSSDGLRLIKVDTVPPSIIINGLTNGSTYYSNYSITFNTTAYDAGSNLSKAVYNSTFWIGVHAPNWVGQPVGGGYFNTTNTSTLTAGAVCVNITINDTAGNTNMSYVCFTLAPTTNGAPYAVNILNPANNTGTNTQRYLNLTGICISNTTPLINVTLKYGALTIANASDITNNTAFYFNESVPIDANWYYNLTCYSTDLLSNTSETRLRKIDIIKPLMKINSPANGTNYAYGVAITIGITASDAGVGLDKAKTNDSIWAGVFSPTAGYFNLTNTSTITAGWHCVNVVINDTIGNTNSSYTCFSKEATPPTLTESATNFVDSITGVAFSLLIIAIIIVFVGLYFTFFRSIE